MPPNPALTTAGTMGGLLSSQKPLKTVVLGLDAAGKTTLLYRLKMGKVVTTIPTIGFNVETIKSGRHEIVCWDVGGRSGIRVLWRHYMQDCDLVIWVVDSNDRERLEATRDELFRGLDSEFPGVPLLVMANKQDLPGAMTTSEVTQGMGLMNSRISWFVQGCCATTGDGLQEGLAWGLREIKRRRQDAKHNNTLWLGPWLALLGGSTGSNTTTLETHRSSPSRKSGLTFRTTEDSKPKKISSQQDGGGSNTATTATSKSWLALVASALDGKDSAAGHATFRAKFTAPQKPTATSVAAAAQ